MKTRFRRHQLEHLLQSLEELRSHCLAMEEDLKEEIDQVAPGCRPSARNLVDYLALRQHDVREVQRELSRLGLSSLGRLEGHTLAAIDAVIVALRKLRGGAHPTLNGDAPVGYEAGSQILARHAADLLGPSVQDAARIMVTMPSEAARRYALVRDLVAAGMDVMRINCAHDDELRWEQMVKHLRRAERETGRSCRVLVDLGGPKLRTGRIEGGARVTHWKPLRDLRGHVIAPARIFVKTPSRSETPPGQFDLVLQLENDFSELAKPGDSIRVTDCRGRLRELTVRGRGEGYCWCESEQSAFVEDGACVELVRGEAVLAKSRLTEISHIEQPLLLRAGDLLVLTDEKEAGRPPRRARNGEVIEAARIPCTLPEAFAFVKGEERIAFDDGAIWGIVRKAHATHLEVEITQAGPRGEKLGSDKGINLPDTELALSPLTAKDQKDLNFALEHSQIVGLSFVHTPEDVRELAARLREMGSPQMGILLKIETRAAFENLPRILLAALQSPPVGVMVARGDLAVEMGYERMAEVQEEILWLCEAAHVPVIWATQVLENLTKKGTPSRAEVTDAAMSARAECVMLNKGPHIVESVRFLAGIHERMKFHQEKKMAMLRKLSISELKPSRKQAKSVAMAAVP
ncbi:MAG TPA: pyruvate kinase [Candidatus Limnocylindrales bacterium]|nr:pyruvate kinase [Candidatus Limnocylindrales bacterium]